MYTKCTDTTTDRIIGSPNQFEKELKIAQEGEREAKRQYAAGEHVLTRVRDEKNKLRDSNTKLVEELKDVQAQLSDSVKENKKLRGGMFSMFPNLFIFSGSERNETDIAMLAGILTGRPEEEVS